MKILSVIFAILVLTTPLSAEPPIVVTPSSTRDELIKQKQLYEQYGFLWIKGFFSSEQVHLLECWAEEMDRSAKSILAQASINSPKCPAKNLIVVPEASDPLQVCRTEDMLSIYPRLFHFVEGTITTYLEKLFGEPYVLFKDKLNFKWPGGGAFAPHQDYPAFEWFGPREHVTAMVCIDPANLENGCLHIARDWRSTFADDPSVDAEKLESGSAVLPYIIGGSNHGSIEPDYHERIDWLPLIASAGDLIIFSSYVPHYSEINHSDLPRRAMFFTLNRLAEGDFRRTYYHAKRNDPQNPVFHFGTPTNARNK